MGKHRTTILIGVLSATFFVASPSVAPASSLLSGYGGPGEGNQAMLGSTLINGPRGGSTGGGSTGAGSAAGSAVGASEARSGTGNSAATGAPGAAGGTRTGAGRPGGAPSGGRESGAKARARSGGSRGADHASGAYASLYPAAERVPAGVSNGTLGVSAGDLVLIAIAIGVLTLIGVLTARMARETHAPGRHG